jgi:hypothetical protein
MTDIRINKSVFGTNINNYFNNDTVLFDTVHVNDGSLSEPSISFKNDTNTGFYRELHGGLATSIATGINGKFVFDVGSTTTGNRSYLELYKSDEKNTIIQCVENGSGDGVTTIYDTCSLDNVVANKLTLDAGLLTNLPLDFDAGDGIYKINSHQLGFATDSVLRFEINNNYLGGSIAFRGPNGAVGAPTYCFNNSLNSGIYLSGTNTMGFSTNGVQRMNIATDYVTSVLPLQINYTGNAQIRFQRSDLSYTNATILMNSSNHLEVNSTSGGGKVILNATGGTEFVTSSTVRALIGSNGLRLGAVGSSHSFWSSGKTVDLTPAGGASGSVSISYGATAPVAPYILLSVNYNDGTGANIENIGIGCRNVTTTGFDLFYKNNAGGSAKFYIAWYAII